MVSIGPYTQSMNFTHMFDMNDLRGPFPIRLETPNSISYILSKHPDFTRFYYILKLSKLDNIFNDKQANFTLFVPSDISLQGLPEEFFTNMDMSTARHIVKGTTLDRRISSDVLKDSPMCYFLTKDLPNKLFVSNYNGKTQINNTANVIEYDINACNGLIHVIDKLILPVIF